MEYIYGKNTVDSFIENNEINEIYILNSFKDEKIINKIRKKNLKLSIKDKNFFERICHGANHQGIIATIKSYQYTLIDDFFKLISTKEKAFVVILDGIEDPHNVGAIVRSCEAFSVDGLIIGKHNCCPITSTVAKVSTGALANINVIQVNNITQTIKLLKENGFWIYAAEAFNSQPYESLKYANKVALVVGSEGNGISKLVKEQADFNISIKMSGKVNSLNVSVATGILVSYISLDHSK